MIGALVGRLYSKSCGRSCDDPTQQLIADALFLDSYSRVLNVDSPSLEIYDATPEEPFETYNPSSFTKVRGD